jgi:hypothetical protein
MTAAQEPLTVGGIFDRAVTIVVERWRVLLPLALLLGAVEAIVQAIIEARANGWLIGAAELISTSVDVVLFTGIVAVVADFGGRCDLGSLVRLGLLRFWSAAGVVVLSCLALIVVIFISFIPSSLLRYHESELAGAAFIGGIGVALALCSFLTIYVSIAYVNVVLESMSPLGAIRASTHRVKSAGAGRALLLGAALVVLTFAPAFLAALIPDRPPLLLACKQLVMFGVLTPIFVYPTVVQTVAAIDYRHRSLGTDIARIVEARAQV